ncbi:MAG: DUF3565 domain-containing protein [Gammaproteobacteria bacterium]|nr:DUF3565 domain-containing protein [Gammaproteobacteria bacterium]MCF6260924.1 DUF3565 domain-containing protein [Gammaproteobacteria bacterium]
MTFKRAIIGFHQDERDDWVADLACGHTQHVRHRPPWQLRPWVISVEGRTRHLGQILVCKKCMKPPGDFEMQDTRFTPQSIRQNLS